VTERTRSSPIRHRYRVGDRAKLSMKTAKTLGLTFPLPLLGRADEVIE
jgi:hypothetical protein